MMRALLLLLSSLADYETMRDLAHSAFTAGLVSMSILCFAAAVFLLRRSRLIRG
jgi:hypothetical protein